MKATKWILPAAIVAIAAFGCLEAFSAAIPNTAENPNIFLGPIARVGITAPISDYTAFSLLGEGGPKNWRLGGTLGWQVSYYHRIKASAELLRQKLTYSFFDGQQSAWMNQGALGLRYEYDFREDAPFNTYNTLLTLSGYYSHAPSRMLSNSSGSYLNNGVTQYYTVYRHVAGSNAAGISPGITIMPWEGTSVSGELNYDNVRYNNVYTSKEDPKGLGGTLALNQALTDNLNVGISGAVRQPFTNYQADVNYSSNSLFEAIESVAIPGRTIPAYKDTANYKDAPKYKDAPMIALPTEWETVDGVNKEFLNWTSKPAVYMPVVLAVADPKTVICLPPAFSGPIADVDTGLPFSYNLSQNFSGTNLTYTIDYGAQVNNGSLYISNGILIGNGPAPNPPPNYPGGFYAAITITATNSCGSAVSNTFTVE
jgi:hypothetical protein